MQKRTLVRVNREPVCRDAVALRRNELEGIGFVSVDDGDSIVMAQRLSAELGLGVGISSGANLLGAVVRAAEMGPEASVVTVFSDDNKKYLSTGLMNEQPVESNHLSPHIELRGFIAHKRVCVVCCEGEECERVDSTGIAIGPYCARRSSGQVAN